MSTRRPAKMPRRALRSDSSSENKAADKSIEDKKPANSECELTYDVLTIIFKKLNAKDLRSAARVCRCWSEAAENEKRVRADSALTLFGDTTNSWSSLHPGEPLVDRLRLKPVLSLSFHNSYDEAHPEINKKKADCFCGSLPSSCPNIIVGNRGVVMDKSEVFKENQEKVACIFLPEEHGVTVQTICIPVANANNEGSSHRSRQASSRVKRQLKKFPIIKNKVEAIILLHSGDDAVGYNGLENIARDRYESLWGGNVGNLAVCRCDENGKLCNEPMAFIGILISGPSVRSWCIVVGRNYNTKEKVEAKLKLLKHEVKLRKHSIGFMFACYARGESMFGEKDVESTIFKKLFPEVPLIGSSGDGEIGEGTIDWVLRRVHQYSTVFMILTYG